MAASVLLIVCGVIVSVFSATEVGHNDADKSLKSFQQSSAAITSALQLAIERENDLVVSATAYFLTNPSASQAEFLAWSQSMQAFDRYPELQGLGLAVIVPAAQLPAFEAQAAEPFNVEPAGARPFYCLGPVGDIRAAGQGPAAGFDYCASDVGRATYLGIRDTGRGSYVPVRIGGNSLLNIVTPIYRGAVAPTTMAARRDAFVGGFGIAVRPQVLLERALQGHPATAVAFRYHQGSSDVSFSTGTAPRGARSLSTDLHNGWTVDTFGLVDRGGTTAGNAVTVLIAGIAVAVLLGLLMFVLGTGRERARRQLHQRTGQLHHQALHDALTGLPNRALVMDRIEQMLVRDRRNRTTGAVLFLDLDEFKNVNDTLGHGAGDRLLIAVATRLTGTLRGADTIGRMGGDEFVVVIDNTSEQVAPELVAERMLDVMRQPFELDDASMPLTVNVSIGVASGDRASAGELLRDADIALYQAKAAGKNRYATFDPQTQTTISRRAELEYDLRSALSNNQYRLVYQPIYDLRDLTIVGVEALLRWDHPARGVISPDEFIPILEQTAQIREVGRWVLLDACQQMATWHAKGDTLEVSVNVSARQLDDDDIITDIRDALRTSGLSAASLIIEVTETALMHNGETTALRLREIKKLGVRIAVDDFGTGYSSLAYLQRFPVDSLKIDRVFTNAISTSPESRALVATLVQLGKDLGLSTLAEGVETTQEIDLLRGATVNQAQGFLMATPLDPEALETQLLLPTRRNTPAINWP